MDVVYPPCQLVEARLQVGPLRLRVRDYDAQHAAELRVGDRDPALGGLRELLVLALEGCLRLTQPRFQPLLARVARVREPLGEDRLGLPHEGVDAAVELTREPARRFLPRRA
jgi:hypothetical protein